MCCFSLPGHRSNITECSQCCVHSGCEFWQRPLCPVCKCSATVDTQRTSAGEVLRDFLFQCWRTVVGGRFLRFVLKNYLNEAVDAQAVFCWWFFCHRGSRAVLENRLLAQKVNPQWQVPAWRKGNFFSCALFCERFDWNVCVRIDNHAIISACCAGNLVNRLEREAPRTPNFRAWNVNLMRKITSVDIAVICPNAQNSQEQNMYHSYT